MGIFNHINEINRIPERHIRRKPPLFLSSSTEDTSGGLFRWIVGNASPGLVQNGNNITIKQNCTLIILVDAIKITKGKVALQLINKAPEGFEPKAILLQSYKAENNRKNESISINYTNQFKKNDVISIEGLNVKNIQLTIYGI